MEEVVMKKLKSISTSMVGFVLIVVVYLVVNSLGGDVALEPDTEQVVVETPVSEGQGDGPTAELIYAEGLVERVVDGDTIVVLMDGESVKVRLSGIDTPESVGDYKDNPEFYGKEASAYTEALLEGVRVYLELDVKPYDKYDRLLAYVWLTPPASGDLRTDCINGRLIREGYATWFDDYDNIKYADAFEQYEKSAKKMALGLWAQQ